jgi:MFS family permease
VTSGIPTPAAPLPPAARNRDSPPPRFRPLRAAEIAIVAVFLANGTAIGVWAAHIPLLSADHQLSERTLGVVLLGFAVGAITTMMLTGALTTRYDGGRVTVAAGLAFCAALPLPAFAPGTASLFAGTLLLGACNGAMDVSMNTVAAIIERLRGSPIMSRFHAFFSLGGLAGAAVSGLLVRLELGARANMALAGGILSFLVLAAGTVLWRPHLASLGGERPLRPEPFPHRHVAFHSSVVRRFGAIAFCAAIAEGAMVDWTGVYLARVLDAPLAFAAAGFAAFSVSMTVGRLSGDRIVARLGRGRVLAGSGVLAAAGVGLSQAATTPVLAAAGFGVAGLGLANVIPLAFAAGAQAMPASPGVGVATVATMGYGGFLLGPPAIGFLASAIGLRAALGVLVVSGITVTVLGAPRRRG